jgi:hypothetical protein
MLIHKSAREGISPFEFPMILFSQDKKFSLFYLIFSFKPEFNDTIQEIR